MGVSQAWPHVPAGNKDHTQAAVVIIGAGISGMCMAIDLIKRNQCHNFVILEKSSGVGGTWNDNKYPGCCCDVWSMLYSYSFEQNPDWTREYPSQEEILNYLRNVAHKYQLYKYIRFNTSAEGAMWDEGTSRWKVDVVVTGGKDAEFSPRYSIECDFLVSAVGQLNQPKYPDVEGLDGFEGKVMHSARWDWSYRTEGKRIGVIGNGATAAQIIPEILPASQNLVIYQRSPNWIVPRLDGPVSALRRALHRYVPPILWRTRAVMMDFREGFYDLVIDSKSPAAEETRQLCIGQMKSEIPDRPDLWEKLTPKYSPGCKRVIVSDDYYPAVNNPKTHLETNKIIRITPTGVQVEDGNGGTTHHEHDVLVLATGFRTLEFLHPLKITGINKTDLSSVWSRSGGAQALYGTTIPSMPNFGMFYGPNTNLGHNSIILMIESQSRYLNGLVGAVLDARKRGAPIGIMPKEQRTRDYNDKVQEILKRSSFADPACNSWYKNAEGRITNNWSGTVVEYQQMMSRIDWEDFELVGGGKKVESASKVVFGDGKTETKVGRAREGTCVGNTDLMVGMIGAVAVGGIWAYRRVTGKRLGWW